MNDCLAVIPRMSLRTAARFAAAESDQLLRGALLAHVAALKAAGGRVRDLRSARALGVLDRDLKGGRA